MSEDSFFKQLRNNEVAIISLIVAIIALLYTAWREDTTEKNRNLRLAGFEVLKNLGELQIVVNYSYFDKGTSFNPMNGWGHIALIGDLGQLLPPPVPAKIEHLIGVWDQEWSKIKTDKDSVDLLTQEIDVARETVLKEMRDLR